MKILVDLTSLADNFSGIERYAACLTKEMIKNQKNDYILVFKNEVHPMFQENINDSNIGIVVIPGCKKLIFNQIKLPLTIYRQKADCYLFLAFPVPVLLFKKNMISTIHDICCWDCPETMNGMSNWYFKISHKIATWKCKRIITISKFSENRIVEKLKYPQNKIWLIYCGVDDKFLNYQCKEENIKNIKEKYHLPEKYLLSLSTLEPRKNLRLLVDAYRELVLKDGFDIPLVLAGRKGWKMDQLFHGIEEKVQEKIIFTGFIDDEDLPAVYNNAMLFVFPSMYEGFGMPPLEALACGTAVLSSDASSLPEVLGDSARYFKSEDKDSLIKNLKRYSENNHFVPGNVLDKFNWTKEAEKLLHYIDKL